MQLFRAQNQTLTALSEIPFKLEKEIQTLFEKNLYNITDLVFVKSEFSIKNRRIDTLAFDAESNAFVIIEYKRDKNYSVIDQGVSYLNLMLEYQADFILEYNESLGKHLKRHEVDWSQSKVMFVAPSFSDDQKQSTNFKDLLIELWEIKRFDGLVFINPIQKSKSAPSIKQFEPKDKPTNLQKITQTIKSYDEEYHLSDKSDDIQELYHEFKTAIINLADDIEIKPTKVYIGFKKKQNICSIAVMKNSLKFWLNLKLGSLKDEKSIARDVSTIGHHGLGDYEIIIKDNKHKEYIMSLVKQVFNP